MSDKINLENVQSLENATAVTATETNTPKLPIQPGHKNLPHPVLFNVQTPPTPPTTLNAPPTAHYSFFNFSKSASPMPERNAIPTQEKRKFVLIEKSDVEGKLLNDIIPQEKEEIPTKKSTPGIYIFEGEIIKISKQPNGLTVSIWNGYLLTTFHIGFENPKRTYTVSFLKERLLGKFRTKILNGQREETSDPILLCEDLCYIGSTKKTFDYQRKRFFDFTSNETNQPHQMPYFTFEGVISSVTCGEIYNPEYTIKIQDIPEHGDETTLKSVSFFLLKCQDDFYEILCDKVRNPPYHKSNNNDKENTKNTIHELVGSVWVFSGEPTRKNEFEVLIENYNLKEWNYIGQYGQY